MLKNHFLINLRSYVQYSMYFCIDEKTKNTTDFGYFNPGIFDLPCCNTGKLDNSGSKNAGGTI